MAKSKFRLFKLLKKLNILKIHFVEKYLDVMDQFEHKHRIINSLIVGTGVILFGAGIWMAWGMLIFPNNPVLQTISFLVLGFICIIFNDLKIDELV